MFFSLTFMTFTALFSSLFTFPSEKFIMYKERASGMYRLSAYYCAKLTTDLPLVLCYPFLFMCITYWMVGLRQSAAFLLYVLVAFGNIICAQGVGLDIGAYFLDMKKAQVAASIFTLLMMLTAGFLVADMPVWIEWVKYLSFIRYSYQICLSIQFSGRRYACELPPPGRTDCDISGLKDLLQQDPNADVWPQVLALVGFMLLYRVLGYAILTLKSPK